MEKLQEIKQIEVLNYHIFLVPSLIGNLVLAKKERSLRKKLYNIFEKQNKFIIEELEVLRVECADVDDKGEKIVSVRQGNNVQYQITGDNLIKLNNLFAELLNESVVLDILPSDVSYLPQIVEFLENSDMKLNVNDEKAIENLCSVLRGEKEEEGKEEKKTKKEEKVKKEK